MEIRFDSKITIKDPSKEILDYINRELVLDNPEYTKKVKMGRTQWLYNTPKKISLYEKIGDDYVLPYGCIDRVRQFCGDTPIESNFSLPTFVYYRGETPLYDYQKEAVEAMYKAGYGILQSRAGSGKTQMGIALAAKYGSRTLWLTHTKDLLEQSYDRAKQYYPEEEFGTITGGKVNVGKTFTFATVQTLVKADLLSLRDVWDVIIVDEIHRAVNTPSSVTMFGKVLNALRARHKFGMSATVHRSDGMIRATFALVGEVQHIVPDEAIDDKVMDVLVRPYFTEWSIPDRALDTDGTIQWSKMVTAMCEDPDRNQTILELLKENQEHSCLVLSDRLSQLRELYESLPDDIKAQSGVINGSQVRGKELHARRASVEKMRTGENHFLFATYNLAKEGLDIQRLDRLFLLTPHSDYAVITQAIGRISRRYEGKGDPIVYDLVDNGKFFNRKWRMRCTHYRKNHATIETK